MNYWLSHASLHIKLKTHRQDVKGNQHKKEKRKEHIGAHLPEHNLSGCPDLNTISGAAGSHQCNANELEEHKNVLLLHKVLSSTGARQRSRRLDTHQDASPRTHQRRLYGWPTRRDGAHSRSRTDRPKHNNSHIREKELPSEVTSQVDVESGAHGHHDITLQTHISAMHIELQSQ